MRTHDREDDIVSTYWLATSLLTHTSASQKTSASRTRQAKRKRGFSHERTRNQTHEWYTPPEVFDALGLKFDLDPCSPGAKVVPWVPARRCYTTAEDGFQKPWSGTVWMNPPYGAETARWMERLAEHGDGIALVFSRTDTRWFHDSVTQADRICFIEKRLRFMRPDGTRGGSPGAGSMLVGYGHRASEAIDRCGLGLVVRL